MRDEVGVNLAKGIGLGFEDEMSAVSKDMADSIPTSFDVDATINGKAGAQTQYAAMVQAFKEALTEVKVELDGEEAGRFVDQTVSRLIYS